MFSFMHKPSKGSSSSEDLAESRKSPSPSDSGSISSASILQLNQAANNVFADLNEKTAVKEPDGLDGQNFVIRNCTNSVIAILDHSSSITCSSTVNCVLIFGPCRGSISVRDCSNCLLLVACQQFRASNCHDIEAHLHSTTAPTIEDTDLIVAPLLMSYRQMDAHMAEAGLDRTVNRWREVQNFTPDTGKFRVMPFDPFGNGAIACEVIPDELLERLSTFMEQPCANELLLGPS